MNDVLAERIRRKLDTLTDEQAYQVLDYVEFLESKYAQRAAGAPAFQRFQVHRVLAENCWVYQSE